MMQCAADSVADRKLYYIGIYIYIYQNYHENNFLMLYEL